MKFDVKNPLFEWRGPAPFYFVAITEEESALIKSVATEYTYGWGVLYATIRMGSTVWTTALIPKDGSYFIPIKDAIRKQLGLKIGDLVECAVTLGK
jgi:hypothetical protein